MFSIWVRDTCAGAVEVMARGARMHGRIGMTSNPPPQMARHLAREPQADGPQVAAVQVQARQPHRREHAPDHAIAPHGHTTPAWAKCSNTARGLPLGLTFMLSTMYCKIERLGLG